MSTGQELKQNGMARADAHANRDWRAAADEVVAYLAKTRSTFTVDDVRDLLDRMHGINTHNLSALGPVMLRAARAGFIEKHGYALSTHASRHKAPTLIWASLVRERGQG